MTMEAAEEAEAAIMALNSTDIMSQIITVGKVEPLQCGEFVTCLTLWVCDEQAQCARARTPTLGHYCGPRMRNERHTRLRSS